MVLVRNGTGSAEDSWPCHVQSKHAARALMICNSHCFAPDDGYERAAYGYHLILTCTRDVSASVPVEPVPNDLVSLLWLVPEKTVAAALHHGEFGVANIIAKMFRRDHMVAGIGIGFIFASH
jgi:hypothetical protein